MEIQYQDFANRLARGQTLSPRDYVWLTRAMDALGLWPADLERDIATIQEYGRLYDASLDAVGEPAIAQARIAARLFRNAHPICDWHAATDCAC